MNSETRLIELFEYIQSLEEKARSIYDEYLTRMEDLEIIEEIQKIRNEEAQHVEIAEELLRVIKKYKAAELRVSSLTRHRIRFAILYVLAGVLLGLGAPVGSCILKVTSGHSNELMRWLQEEMSSQRWYYLYMTIGTVLAFGLAGFVVAFIHTNLRLKTRNLTVKARLLEDLSTKDSLTGLQNFGYIRERLEIELERSKRFGTPLSCLMIDIDNLKEINDRYGHPAGDLVISRLAGLLKKEIRLIDTASRYGGDEFFLILPVTPGSGAYIVAERVRKKIKELSIQYDDSFIKTTVSVGLATFPSPQIEDADSLVMAADQVMYKAKNSGRDRTFNVNNQALATVVSTQEETARGER